MPTNIRFKGLTATTTALNADRFQGRIAYDSTLSRFVVSPDGTTWAIMARRDVLETFAAGILDSTLTSGRVMVAGTSGRHGGDAGLTYTRTGAVTDLVSIGDGTTSQSVLQLNGDFGGRSTLRLQRAGVTRWSIQRFNTDFLLVAQDAAGTTIDTPISIPNTSAGAMTFGGATNRALNLTGALQTSGVTRISSGGAGTLTTLSTSSLATLAQATVSDLTTGRVVTTTTGGRLQTLTNTASLALIGAADNEAVEDANMMTGFSDPANITQSYNSSTRVVTITHASGTVEYWFKGRKFTQASPWTLPAHTATVGNWFYSSSDGTTFAWSTTPWEFEHVLVSYVRYGTYLKFSLRECHGMMDPMVHRANHNNIGTYLGSGGTLTAATYQVQPASPVDADNTPGVDLTTLYDEDILTSLPALPQGTYAVCWPVGSELNVQSLSVPFRVTAAGYINWFDSGVETQAANNRYLNVYAVAMPVTADATSQSYRWIWIAPQASYTTATDAAAETFSEINAGDISAGITEYLPRFKITYATSASYTTTGKCRIHAVETLDRSKVNATTTTTPVALTLDGLTDVDTAGQATGDILVLESDGIWRTQPPATVSGSVAYAPLFTGRRTVAVSSGVGATLIPSYTVAANGWSVGKRLVFEFNLFTAYDGQVEVKIGGNTIASYGLGTVTRSLFRVELVCLSTGATGRFAYGGSVYDPSTSTATTQVIIGDSQASVDGVGDNWSVDTTSSTSITFTYTPSGGSGNAVVHSGSVQVFTP